jgi:hypothetical protein
MSVLSIKGLYYRNKALYEILTAIKLRKDIDRRYQIASSYIHSGESVIDVCAGSGQLKKFLPPFCSYLAIEASPQFGKVLTENKCSVIQGDLHQGWSLSWPKADVIVMLISLAQFRKTTAHELLAAFKNNAKRVVIVEDVLDSPRLESSWYQRMVNYLCSTDYYVPVSWFTGQEFSAITEQHGYLSHQVSERYWVSIYEASNN